MAGSKITITRRNRLNVPNDPIIPFIEGDGIGVDIWEPARKVIDAAVEKAYPDRKIVWKEVYAGEKAFKKTGEWLPQNTIDVINEHIVAIKGPLTTPVGGGIRSLNVTLRQKLDLFACVRPIKYFNGVPSPVKKPKDVKMVIFRENTEDIYTGIEFLHGTEKLNKLKTFLIEEMGVNTIRFPDTCSLGIKPVSLEGTERLVRAAIKYAIDNNQKSVTLVHKGNIMKFTEGQFKQWGYALAEREFGDKVFTWNQWDRIVDEKGKDIANQAMETALANGAILIKDNIADAFLQQILLNPSEFDVIATLNLNGDYISDALAAQVGGIGIAPGANINYNSGVAIFEATHGTAPKLAGMDKVNPSSVLLSAEMMLRYMGWKKAAQYINRGIGRAIKSKRVTFDFARDIKNSTEVSCSQFCKEIVKNM